MSVNQMVLDQKTWYHTQHLNEAKIAYGKGKLSTADLLVLTIDLIRVNFSHFSINGANLLDWRLIVLSLTLHIVFLGRKKQLNEARNT